jgi:hypothetical protein
VLIDCPHDDRMQLDVYYAEALDLFKTRFKCYPEQAESQKEIARTGMRA